MMVEMAPCGSGSPWIMVFNAVLNVVQAVLLALVANRAVRKNREETEAKRVIVE